MVPAVRETQDSLDRLVHSVQSVRPDRGDLSEVPVPLEERASVGLLASLAPQEVLGGLVCLVQRDPSVHRVSGAMTEDQDQPVQAVLSEPLEGLVLVVPPEEQGPQAQQVPRERPVPLAQLVRLEALV